MLFRMGSNNISAPARFVYAQTIHRSSNIFPFFPRAVPFCAPYTKAHSHIFDSMHSGEMTFFHIHFGSWHIYKFRIS
jgi:hypothetical protein